MMSYFTKFFLIIVNSLSCLTLVAQVHPYYNSIDFSLSSTQVQTQLRSLISSTHNPLSYSNTYDWIRLADQDPQNTNNVILLYNGLSVNKNYTLGGGNTSNPEIWNREHVYPQSMINAPADADLHHLRACDAVINNNRGNLPFTLGSGQYGVVNSAWYPGDEWRGDVARMIFYMYLRYNEPIEDMGLLSTFLTWNVIDPVSDFERQRNQTIQGAQGNRNPFIDQPYLATYFWGGDPAEDAWGWPNTTISLSEESIHIFPNPLENEFFLTIQMDENQWNLIEKISLFDLQGKEFPLSKSTSIYLGNFEAGVYFLHLTSSIHSSTKMLILK
jgi:endonuclease I